MATLAGRAGVRGGGLEKKMNPTLTAESAIRQAIATETALNPRDFATGWYLPTNPAWQAEVRAAQISFPEISQCGGQPASNLSFQQASGFGLQGASSGISIAGHFGAAAAASIGSVALPAVGLVIGIIQTIFQHHQAAVRRDVAAQCALVPASNNAFRAILDAVQAGQISASEGAAALDAIPDQFLQSAGAAKNNSPYCNALCEFLIRVRAIVYYWKSQLQAMIPAQGSAPPGAVNTGSPASLIHLEPSSSAYNAYGDYAVNAMAPEPSGMSSVLVWGLLGAVGLILILVLFRKG